MNLELFKQQATSINHHFDSLSIVHAEGAFYITGTITIVDQKGSLWHTYSIEIHASKQFPYMFPIVFEIGGMIPRIADWHINIDGSCCLDNEFSQQIKCSKGLSLDEFISKELIPWLANQSYRRLTGHYINGEQGHGDIGRIEFFMRELAAPNLLTCVEWLLILASNKFPPRQANCFCNSGYKWRNCHKSRFEKLAQIPSPSLYWAIDKFLSYLKEGDLMLRELQKHTNVNIIQH
jgi:hypothetical protein